VDPFGLLGWGDDKQQHHWLPNVHAPKIKKRCPKININLFTTPLLAKPGALNDHAWLHNHYKGVGWSPRIRKLLGETKTCCEFLLAVDREMLEAWKQLKDRARARDPEQAAYNGVRPPLYPFVTGWYTMEEWRLYIQGIPGHAKYGIQFFDLTPLWEHVIISECREGKRKQPPIDCFKVGKSLIEEYNRWVPETHPTGLGPSLSPLDLLAGLGAAWATTGVGGVGAASSGTVRPYVVRPPARPITPKWPVRIPIESFQTAP
jgi:hypothetical protein